MFGLQVLGDLVIRLGFFYAFISFGYLTTRIRKIGGPLNKGITSLLINIMMPLLIIETLLTANPTSTFDIFGIILFTFFIHFLGLVIMYTRLRNATLAKKEQGAYLLTATFNNALFLPLPIGLILLGEVAVPVIAIYSISQMILLATLGTFLGSSYSEEEDDRNAMLRKALTFPPLLSVVIVGVLFFAGIGIPPALDSFFDANALITTYLALFAVGLSLGAQDVIKKSKYVIETIATRQLIVPVVVGLLLLLTDLSPLVQDVILLQAMMPAAVFTVVYATALGLDSESVATIVTTGTLVLLFAVPIMPLLFG